MLLYKQTKKSVKYFMSILELTTIVKLKNSLSHVGHHMRYGSRAALLKQLYEVNFEQTKCERESEK